MRAWLSIGHGPAMPPRPRATRDWRRARTMALGPCQQGFRYRAHEFALLRPALADAALCRGLRPVGARLEACASSGGRVVRGGLTLHARPTQLAAPRCCAAAPATWAAEAAACASVGYSASLLSSVLRSASCCNNPARSKVMAGSTQLSPLCATPVPPCPWPTRLRSGPAPATSGPAPATSGPSCDLRPLPRRPHSAHFVPAPAQPRSSRPSHGPSPVNVMASR